MFKGINTPVIFIQNVIVDMILGMKMYDVFKAYDEYIRKKYNAEPGYITMNMPALLDALNSVGIENPIICSSINKIGFRMSGGIKLYEKYLNEKQFRPIAMQVLAAGALRPKEAIEYSGSVSQHRIRIIWSFVERTYTGNERVDRRECANELMCQ